MSSWRKLEPGSRDQQKEGAAKAHWESDSPIVLGGRESRPHGEAVDEGAKPAKETGAGHAGSEKRLPTSLRGIAKKAQDDKKYRFGNLYGMLDEEFLLETWKGIKKGVASGVDGVSAREYEQNLEENVAGLVERLRKKQYRARLVRRRWIPKGEGKFRPLGIPVVEDKLVQAAVARLLGAIYEEDFLRCSYGYRPGVGAHDAVDKLTVKLQFGKYGHVVEVDMKNYFGTIDHEWLVRMLGERVDDRALIGLIRKWLKAGVLEEDGRVEHPATGSPQGGVISPILANVYLHYVMDLWFHRVVVKQCRGEACLIRYADDVVCAFERAEEASWFMEELKGRVAKFGLELSAEKTRRIEFLREAEPGRTRFDFLGFEFSWGRDRQGRPHIQRRTSRVRLRASIARLTEWCRDERRRRLRPLFVELNSKLRGYYQYYGVYGNYRSLKQFYTASTKILFKWLNRRSQRRSFTWVGFSEVLKAYEVPTPCCRRRILQRS